jgi:transposase InsO family protein
MNSITQDILYKQSVVKYSYKHGVTKAAIKFKMHRKTIYRWREKYDGTAQSLKNKSRRPHSHPNQHTEKEIKMIKDYKNKNKETGIVVLWIKLRGAGYTRTITGLYRVMQRIGIYNKAPSKKKEYEPKPYQQMTYPGERVQIDVKYVPKKSLTKEVIEQEGRYYQYTAIDEYTRKRVLWASKEQSTSASTEFIEIIIKKFPFKIECIQTDNGFEFTNRLNWQGTTKKTMFEKKLEELGIKHKLIKPKTPRHNGKVERSHRKDQERFYYNKVFYSFEDFKNRLKYWERVYNNFPMKPLKWLSPNEKYLEYIKG